MEKKEDLFGDISNPEVQTKLAAEPGGGRLHEPYLIWEVKNYNTLNDKRDDKKDIGF